MTPTCPPGRRRRRDCVISKLSPQSLSLKGREKEKGKVAGGDTRERERAAMRDPVNGDICIHLNIQGKGEYVLQGVTFHSCIHFFIYYVSAYCNIVHDIEMGEFSDGAARFPGFGTASGKMRPV